MTLDLINAEIGQTVEGNGLIPFQTLLPRTVTNTTPGNNFLAQITRSRI